MWEVAKKCDKKLMKNVKVEKVEKHSSSKKEGARSIVYVEFVF